jgi:hypothetical protein
MLGIFVVILSDFPITPRAAADAWQRLDAAAGGAGSAVAGALALALAFTEAARVLGERDAERRAYPATTVRGNKLFDPLGLFRPASPSSSSSSPPPPSLEQASRAVYAPWLRLPHAPWWQPPPLQQPSSSTRRRAAAARGGTGAAAGAAGAAGGRARPQLTRAELKGMQSRELAAGRWAMTAFAGVAAASGLTGRGPVTLLMEHLADPSRATVVQALLERGGGGAP